MLKVAISIDSRFGKFGNLGGKNGIKTPGLAERVITLSVSLPATPKLLRRLSGSQFRALILFIGTVLVVFGASFLAHLYKPALHEKELPLPLCQETCNAIKAAPVDAIKAPSDLATRARSASVETYVEAAMTGSVLLVWIALFFLRKKLIVIHVALLRPYEAFPIVPHEIQLAHHEYFYAVRLLGKGAEERYAKFLKDGAIDASFNVFHSTDLVTEHPHELLRLRQWPIRDYSSLVRHALTDLLPYTPIDGSALSPRETIKALYFTFKQHTWTLWWYMTLVGAAIVLPTMNLAHKSPGSQFPLLMGGLGVFWAAFATMLHRSKARHLDQWEYRALGYPFSGCPVFQYTKLKALEETWDLVTDLEFHQRISSFGVDHNTLQQWVLAGLLVIYLAILQLIK